MSGRGKPGIGNLPLLALLLASYAIASIPILVSVHPPFGDYLNHLARFSILARPEATAAYWGPNPAFVPNVGFDLVMAALARVLPIALAGKVGVLLAIGLFGFGFALLHRAVHGKVSAWAASGFLLVTTYPLMMGLLNYVAGLGIMMLLLAGSLAARERPAPRLAIALLGGGVLAATHLMSFLLFLLFAPLFEAAAGSGAFSVRLRRGLLTVGAGLVPLAVVLAISPTRGEIGGIVPSNLGYKEAALRLLTVSGHGRFDQIFAVLIVVLPLALWARREVRPSPALLLLPVAAAGLWLATPYGFKTTLNVDMRLPVVAVLFGFLMFGSAERRGAIWAAAGILLLGSVRAGYLALQWRRETPAYVAVREAIAALPPRTIVLTLRHRRSAAWDFARWHPAMVYAAQQGVLDGRFVSGTFDLPTQQPIVIRPRWAPVDESFEEFSRDGGFAASMAKIRSRVERLGEPHPPVALWIMPMVGTSAKLPADVRSLAKGEDWILASLAEPASR